MRHWRLGLASLLTGALLVVGWAEAEPPTQKQGASRLFAGQGGCSKETQVSRTTGTAGQAGCSKETQVSRTNGAQSFVAQPPPDGFKGKKGKKGKGDGFGKGGKGFGKGGKGGRGTISETQLVDRLLSFDKNNDGKVTKDELPERMQNLIARGDTNKDGALDKDEIRKLAVTLAAEGLPGGFGARGGFGGPFAGGGGFGPKGKGPRAGFGPAAVERTLADLNLKDKTKEKADAIVKAHEENVRRLIELARTDLLVKMKDVLTEQDYKTFKAAVQRQPRAPAAVATSTPTDQNSRLDRLLKEVEDLRREVKQLKR